MNRWIVVDDCYFTALYRARQTVDDFGNLVRVLNTQYHQAVQFYRH